MKPIIREAVYISQDFGDATFVGAIAVMLHADKQRQSQDLDLSLPNRSVLMSFWTRDTRSTGKKTKNLLQEDTKLTCIMSGI